MPFNQVQILSEVGNNDLFAEVSFNECAEDPYLIPFAVGSGDDVELLGWAVGGFYENYYLLRNYNDSASVVSNDTITYTVGTSTFNLDAITISYA